MKAFLRSAPAVLVAAHLSACAGIHTSSSHPHLTPREFELVTAIQAAGEEGGYGASTAGIDRYPYRVARAIAYGYKYPEYLAPIFRASVGTDGASAEMQARILWTVLEATGDRVFSSAMAAAPQNAQRASANLLRHYPKLASSYPLTDAVAARE